jgi:hypothetical protein
MMRSQSRTVIDDFTVRSSFRALDGSVSVRRLDGWLAGPPFPHVWLHRMSGHVPVIYTDTTATLFDSVSST